MWVTLAGRRPKYNGQLVSAAGADGRHLYLFATCFVTGCVSEIRSLLRITKRRMAMRSWTGSPVAQGETGVRRTHFLFLSRVLSSFLFSLHFYYFHASCCVIHSARVLSFLVVVAVSLRFRYSHLKALECELCLFFIVPVRDPRTGERVDHAIFTCFKKFYLLFFCSALFVYRTVTHDNVEVGQCSLFSSTKSASIEKFDWNRNKNL